jgi:hypothetical protein
LLFWGLPCPYFFPSLFSQIIATSHLQPPCHPLRDYSHLKQYTVYRTH